MVFSSISFIYIFLPVFLLVYYLVPAGLRNAVLFLGSLAFYTVGSIDNPEHIAIFVIFLIVNWRIGIKLDARPHANNRKRRAWLTVGLILDIGNLFYFKYMGFAADQFGIALSEIVLPIGISFYTFQAMSYLLDIYRGSCRPAFNIIDFGAYLAMFPQLIAGPIVTYPTVAEALKQHSRPKEHFISGAEIFIFGLASKVLLANQIAGLWRQCVNIGFESITVLMAWMGIFAYSFQLYFDFCGYSLMAIGLGKMLGFDFPENFRDPYMSVSMTEFWRRWHITLGSWFRDYVYIPLGGSRKGKARTWLNLFIVWMLTGIWHGAGYNFLLWGFALFVLISIEKLGVKDFFDRHKWLGHIYMFFAIPLSWALFVNTDFSRLILFFSRLVGRGETIAVFTEDYIKYGRQYGLLLFLCFIFSTDLPRKIKKKIEGTLPYYLIILVLFWAVAWCLYKGMDDPFLYFQF